MLRRFGFPAGTRVLALFDRDTGIKVHPSYKAAKSGDAEAALALVSDLAGDWLFQQEGKFKSGTVFVAPHAKEASGDNAIPQTLSTLCATVFSGLVDREIVQTDRVYHTGADAMERMASRATFEGVVTPDAEYVLVDDVTNLGGTLAELANYIQCHGGLVAGVLVLVNAGRNPALIPERKDVRLIKERFQDEFTEVFGINPDALTANEARYLVGFRSIDAIRDRLAAAKQEIDLRLRSKGLSRSGGFSAGLQAEGALSGHDSFDTPYPSP
jgi:hypothetical protein